MTATHTSVFSLIISLTRSCTCWLSCVRIDVACRGPYTEMPYWLLAIFWPISFCFPNVNAALATCASLLFMRVCFSHLIRKLQNKNLLPRVTQEYKFTLTSPTMLLIWKTWIFFNFHDNFVLILKLPDFCHGTTLYISASFGCTCGKAFSFFCCLFKQDVLNAEQPLVQKFTRVYILPS